MDTLLPITTISTMPQGDDITLQSGEEETLNESFGNILQDNIDDTSGEAILDEATLTLNLVNSQDTDEVIIPAQLVQDELGGESIEDFATDQQLSIDQIIDMSKAQLEKTQTVSLPGTDEAVQEALENLETIQGWIPADAISNTVTTDTTETIDAEEVLSVNLAPKMLQKARLETPQTRPDVTEPDMFDDVDVDFVKTIESMPMESDKLALVTPKLQTVNAENVDTVVNQTANVNDVVTPAIHQQHVRPEIVDTMRTITTPFNQQAAWRDSLNEQILMMSNQRISQASIAVDPPELGPVQIQLQIQSDTATIHFATHHPQVRDAIEQSMPKLRDMLGEQGVDLLDATVTDERAAREDTRSHDENPRVPTDTEAHNDELFPVFPDHKLANHRPTGLVDFYA